MALPQFHGARSRAPGDGHPVKLVCGADIDAVIALAPRVYPGWRFDPASMSAWLREFIASPSALAIWTDRAFCGTSLLRWMYRPERLEAVIIFIGAVPGARWDAVRLISATLDWAKARGVERLRVGAETGEDLGPLMRYAARRVGYGVQAEAPRYMVLL